MLNNVAKVEWYMTSQNPEIDILASQLLETLPNVMTHLLRAVPASSGGTGVTSSQLTVLGYLLTHDECTMQELASGLGVTSATMTAAVKLLVKNGLVARKHDDEDWRTVRITLDDAGRAAHDRFMRTRIDTLATVLQTLPAEHRALLLVCLPALRALAQHVAALPVQRRKRGERA